MTKFVSNLVLDLTRYNRIMEFAKSEDNTISVGGNHSAIRYETVTHTILTSGISYKEWKEYLALYRFDTEKIGHEKRLHLHECASSNYIEHVILISDNMAQLIIYHKRGQNVGLISQSVRVLAPPPAPASAASSIWNLYGLWGGGSGSGSVAGKLTTFGDIAPEIVEDLILSIMMNNKLVQLQQSPVNKDSYKVQVLADL